MHGRGRYELNQKWVKEEIKENGHYFGDLAIYFEKLLEIPIKMGAPKRASGEAKVTQSLTISSP